MQCRPSDHAMLLVLLALAAGTYIASPLHTPQLAKHHGADALLPVAVPRAAPSVMVFDPTAIVHPTAVAFGAVVGIPVRIAIQVTSDALQAAKKGTSFEARRVEVCVLRPASFASASGTHLGLCVMRWTPPPACAARDPNARPHSAAGPSQEPPPRHFPCQRSPASRVAARACVRMLPFAPLAQLHSCSSCSAQRALQEKEETTGSIALTFLISNIIILPVLTGCYWARPLFSARLSEVPFHGRARLLPF